MEQKIKTTMLLFLGGFFILGAQQFPSFLTKKKTKHFQSPAKLKELIGYELEDVLTLSADLIAFLAESQRSVIADMHMLLAPEKGTFFADAKAKKLNQYLEQLKIMHQQLKRIDGSIKKEFAGFSKNFNT